MSDVGQAIPRRALTPNPRSSAGVYNSGMSSIDGAKHIGDLMPDRNIILEGFDAISQRGFTQVPNYVLREFDISPGAKLAYTMLLSYAWQNDFCFPGQDTLAEDMRVSLRSIGTYIKELETVELLSVTRRGLGRSNLYKLSSAGRTTPRSNRATHSPSAPPQRVYPHPRQLRG